jgi:endo-1,4-beta-xylanase
MEEAANNAIAGFDIVITDGNDKYAFNDKTMTQDSSSKYYAEMMLKPFMYIPMGKALIDGEYDDAYNAAVEVVMGNVNDAPKATATAKLLWDQDFLYVYAEVKDADLNKANEEPHEQDSFEVFIDETNSKDDAYNAATKQYRINFENEHTFNGDKCTEENLQTVAKKVDGGYIVEGAFKWTEVKPKEGDHIGIELQINDADASGARVGTLTWNDLTNQCWSSPSCFGTAVLTGAAEYAPAAEQAEPTEAVETTKDDSNSTAVGVVLLATAAAVGGFAALSGRKKNS